jgi:hypothetical protein
MHTTRCSIGPLTTTSPSSLSLDQISTRRRQQEEGHMRSSFAVLADAQSCKVTRSHKSESTVKRKTNLRVAYVHTDI